MPSLARLRPHTQADGDGGLTRSEFVSLCSTLLRRVPVERLTMAASNYYAALEQERAYYSMKWQGAAQVVEAYARHLIPSTYCVTLAWLFVADFRDDYAKAGTVIRAGLVSAISTRSPCPLRDEYTASRSEDERPSFTSARALISTPSPPPASETMLASVRTICPTQDNAIVNVTPGNTMVPISIGLFTVATISIRCCYMIMSGGTQASKIAAALKHEQAAANKHEQQAAALKHEQVAAIKHEQAAAMKQTAKPNTARMDYAKNKKTDTTESETSSDVMVIV